MKPEKTTEFCQGCRNDFYNRDNPLGVKECWFLKDAKVVTRYEIGLDTLPAQPGAFRKIRVYQCYYPDGIAHYDELPEFAKEVRDDT